MFSGTVHSMSSQTWSIQQAMEAMRWSEASPNATKSKTSKAKVARLENSHRIVLPLPKRVGISKERRLFYGFEVTDRIRDYNPNRHSMAKMFLAMKLLAASSKIRNLTIEGAICRVSESWLQLGGEEGCVSLVCVCSSMKDSYEWRPTDAQLNKLRSIIGKEPDWFVDFHPSSYYG